MTVWYHERSGTIAIQTRTCLFFYDEYLIRSVTLVGRKNHVKYGWVKVGVL